MILFMRIIFHRVLLIIPIIVAKRMKKEIILYKIPKAMEGIILIG